MGGVTHRPSLCQILLLLLVLVTTSFVGQVSGRARIVRSTTDDLSETPDDHTSATTTEQPSTTTEADSGDRKRRAVGGSNTSPFLCPEEYQGVNYQCIDQSACQPENVWQGATCVGGYSQVCCRTSQAATTGTSTGDSSSENFQRGNVDYYNLPRNLLTQLLSPEALEAMTKYSPTQKCGVRSPIKSQQCLFRGRIASGNEDAESCFGEWPWHVALLEKQRHKCNKPRLTDYDRWRLRCHIVYPVDMYRYICGGTLISPSHVLTAAHCVKGVRQDRLKLHLGDYNLYSSNRELLPELQRSVLEATIHEGYDPYTYEDDLAILTLDKAVDLRLTPHISPVCLPSVDHEFTESDHCTIVGWGEDPYKPNHGSNILKSVDVTIGTEEECEDKLGTSYTLGRHQLCIVGNLGTDACLGDGGGAVVCPIKSDTDFGRHFRGSANSPDKYVAVGIISWGSESCGENSVTVINMILPYLGWIGMKTSPRRQPGGYYGYQQHPGQGGNTSPCEQNPFLKVVQSDGYGAIAGKRMLLHDIVCVFGGAYTNNPNYKFWYDSVFGPGAGAGVLTSPTTDAACNENKFFIKVRDHGYAVIAKAQMSLEDIKCVFGEDFVKNPNYKIWFDSVHGASTSPGTAETGCEENSALQNVITGGYGTVSGKSLTLEDIQCVFGVEFTGNPNYKIWFDSVHGSGTSPGAGPPGGQGSSTIPVVPVTGCEQNPFLQKVEAGGYGAITGMDLTTEDILCVFGEDFESNPNYKIWSDSVQGSSVTTSPVTDACKESINFNKVQEQGYSSITGTILTLEEIVCVFGEDFTRHPSYNPWFVSVFCVPESGLKQYPATCCEPHNFKAEICCGADKLNPPGLCGGGLPGY